jgi:hippurate hydrolase
MVDDGMMERFAIEEVYGMHNMPGLPSGHFAMRPGPMMASSDVFDIEITGNGAHAAKPHNGVDPVLVAAHVITALQSIVSRNTDPLKNAVVSVTSIQAGNTYNVIPGSAHLRGTCRALEPGIQDLIERRLVEIADLTARAFGATAKTVYQRNYPVTRNHASQAKFCGEIARHVVGHDNVNTDAPPEMGAEDFSFMLQARPGAFVFIGNGDTAGLHNPAYDFNDAIIPTGISYWTRLAEGRLT